MKMKLTHKKNKQNENFSTIKSLTEENIFTLINSDRFYNDVAILNPKITEYIDKIVDLKIEIAKIHMNMYNAVMSKISEAQENGLIDKITFMQMHQRCCNFTVTTEMVIDKFPDAIYQSNFFLKLYGNEEDK